MEIFELELIEENIEKKLKKIIYYDAWKNDHHSDAFQSIVYNILNEFPKYKDIVTDFKEVKNMFCNIGKNILNTISGGIISPDIIDFDKISTYEEYKWVSKKELENFQFAPADLFIIDKLKK